MIICFDFETYPIAPGLQIPPAVCMSYAILDGQAIVGSGVVSYAEGIRYLAAWLADPDFTLVGANTAFDILASVYSAPDPDRMLALWVGACEANRVTDVLLRQKLIDLACDGYLRPSYGLGAVTERSSGRVLDKANPWRVRFGELDGVPTTQYPAEAYAYSLEDATATAECYAAQELQRQAGSPHFPGRDILHNQWARQLKALALKDLESWGLRVDQRAAGLLLDQVSGELDQCRDHLVARGLVRRKVSKDRKAIVDYVKARGLTSHFANSKGAISLGKANLLTSGDALLESLPYWPHVDTEPLIQAGLCRVEYNRNLEAARMRMVQRCDALGLAPKETDKGGVCLDNDACQRTADREDTSTWAENNTLLRYADYLTLDKTRNDTSKLIAAGSAPIHAHYNPLIATGRTATSNPNEQNQSRKPGIRECRVPPSGMVQVEVDFSAVELHGFAQICYWVLGWSQLGDDLNAGIDVHLQTGVTWHNIQHPEQPLTYEQGVALKKAGDADIKKRRTGGKGVGFGRKGGMGAVTFVDYCWNNYGLHITLDEAEQLIAAHDKATPEFALYSQWVQSMGSGYRKPIHVLQPYSGRLRANCGFPDAHNSPFQGLAADLAGVTLWAIFKATRGLSALGKQDPLYGCRLCLFVHDSFMVDAPESRGHEVAMRLQQVAEECGRRVMPDCPPRAEPVISRQLSKLAEPVWEGGRLVPWCVWEQCSKAHDRGAGIAELREQDWPEYVIQATVYA